MSLSTSLSRAAAIVLTMAATSCAIDDDAWHDTPDIDEHRAGLHRAPTVARLSPASGAVTAATGERIGFEANGADADGDLWGVEWYLNGAYLGARYRTSLPGATGSAATFWRGINFPSAGTHTVEALAFDRAGNYTGPVVWTVTVAPRPRVLYVTAARRFYEDTAARDRLFALAAERDINTFILYGVDNDLRAMSDAGPTPAPTCTLPASTDPRWPLAAFIADARAHGIDGVHVAIGAVRSNVDHNLRALERYACDFARVAPIDGAVTEYEFWNGASWSVFEDLLDGLNGIAARRPFEVSVYLGAERLRSWQIAHLRPRVDRLLLTAYVDSPDEAFANLRTRLQDVARLGDVTEVWPIFSAEERYEQEERCMSSGTNFMGDWFGAFAAATPLAFAEDAVSSAFRTAGGRWRNGVRITGFAFFNDRYLQHYLDNGPSVGQQRPPTLCPEVRTTASDPIVIAEGGSFTFWANGWDPNGNLSGTEWYGHGHPDVAYNSAGNPGLQYVSATVGGTGADARFGRHYQFLAPGTYTITAIAFDTDATYSAPTTWVVHVPD